MNRRPDMQDLATAISAATGRRLAPAPDDALAGTSAGACVRWGSNSGPMFVKVAGAGRAWTFEAEAEGLRALGSASAIRVPRVIGAGVASSSAWLALEWIDLLSPTPRSEARLGELLAEQHRATSATFGWHRTNTIGLTDQQNEPDADWAHFHATRRLAFQLDLAESAGHRGRLVDRGRRLCERVPLLLGRHSPAPSLLHGDLWAGNHAEDSAGRPVIFDPAVHFGDREADLAMTRLFGGYGRGFYTAYEAAWPLEPGAIDRVPLYNLYHVLNHLNLFGGGYRRQAEEIIERLLAETG
jgi:protein-ribulosamine 3-kinase